VRLLRELQENNPDDFKNYRRMDETAFSELLTAVTPYIVKHDTAMRPEISPKERLTATLRFLVGKTARGSEIHYWDNTTAAGKNHTRNMLSDISRTDRVVFEGNAYIFCSKSGKSSVDSPDAIFFIFASSLRKLDCSMFIFIFTWSVVTSGIFLLRT
jgi:hypothetical protein